MRFARHALQYELICYNKRSCKVLLKMSTFIKNVCSFKVFSDRLQQFR